MLYTGWWFRDYPSDVVTVQTSLSVPRGRSANWIIRGLMPPDWSLVCKKYRRIYNRVLREALASGLLDKLVLAAKSQDVVLLCWEEDRNRCHRGLLAAFLKKHRNMQVPEWRVDR